MQRMIIKAAQQDKKVGEICKNVCVYVYEKENKIEGAKQRKSEG